MSHCQKTNDHREEGASFTNHDDRSSNAKVQSDPSTNPRVLALHGKASNGEVTKLQLANLGITEQHYHIVFLDGPIVEEDEDAEVTDFVAGPFYSWFYGDYSDARYKESFFNALLHVFKAIQNLGTFDVIYGFSQGATVAAFASLVFTDSELRNAFIAHNEDGSLSDQNGQSTMRKSGNRTSLIGGAINTLRKSKRAGNAQSISISIKEQRGSIFKNSRWNSSRRFGSSIASSHIFKKSISTDAHLSENFFNELEYQEPFNYKILACPVEDPAAIREALGLENQTSEEDKCFVSIPTMLLVGMSDPRKLNSVKMESMFSNLQVKYMVGGHTVSRHVSSDESLLTTLKKNIKEGENTVELKPPTMKKVSDLTTMGLMSSVQVAHVELDHDEMANTLVEALTQKDRNQALLYNARETDSSISTSYGDLLDFIEGPGDLRRLGVKQGEVVAYGAPPGGGELLLLIFSLLFIVFCA
jgi:hypothetical protein